MYNMKFRNDFKMFKVLFNLLWWLLINDEKLKEICDDLEVVKVKVSIMKSREI